MGSSKRSWLLQEFSAHSVGLSAASLGKKSGRVMATGGEDGQVNLWAVGKPSSVMSFAGHSSAVEALSFSSSEELVCAGSRSGQLRIWNISEGKVTRSLLGHKAAVTCIDFLSIGEFIASGSLDHKVKMWDFRRRGCIFQYTGHQGAINALQFSPDGRWVSSVSDDGVCKIWDLSTGKLLHQFSDHGAPVTCLQFHPNELLLATGGKDKTLKVYDVEQFKMVSSSKPQSSAVLKVAFSESGHCVYSASQDMCHAYIWEPEPRNTDAVVVKWGRPADVVVSAKQLISTSFTQNIVMNHVVDLAKVKTSPFELPNTIHPFEPPPTVTPFAPTDNITIRSPRSVAISVRQEKPIKKDVGPHEPEIKYFNNNHKVELPPAEVFQPQNTLRRSPSDKKPTKVISESHIQAFKPSPSTHKATNILPHLRPDTPLTDVKVNAENLPSQIPEKNTAVETPSNNSPLLDVPSTVDKAPAIDIPTRDRPLPDSKSQANGAIQKVPTPEEPPTMNESLDNTHMTTIIPSSREDAVGLDMNAFLPAKKDPVFGREKKTLSNEEAIANIKKGFESMRIVLTTRSRNLDVVRAMWTGGNIMTAMNTAVRMKDQALMVDLFSVLKLKKSLWSLDLCQVNLIILNSPEP